MSGFRDFLGWLVGKPTAEQAKALTISLAPGGFVNEVVTEIRGWRGGDRAADTAALESTMALNELVYACINIKATAARDPRLLVQQQVTRNGKVEYEEVAGHPFRQLIMRPNPKMTEGDLMRAAIVSWDVSNPRRFFCEKIYKNSLLTEMWPLNPAQMSPRYNSDRTEVIGYTWSDGRRKKDYTLDELLIRSAPVWYDPPPLVSALGSTKSDTAQTEYIWSFFENGGVPQGFLKYKMPLGDERRDEIRDKWRSVYGRSPGSGQIGVLDENVDYEEIGSRLDQLASQTLRSVAESRICMVFGVPPLIVYAYVGLLRATYANLKEAWAGFWDATMSPAFKEWRDFWMWSLLTEFEDESTIRSEKVRLNYDMSQVAALQDDVDLIQKRARDNYSSGLINQDEGRAAIGYASTPGGSTTFARSAAPATAPAKGRKSRDSNSVQVVERRMERTLQQYLSGQYDAAAQAVE